MRHHPSARGEAHDRRRWRHRLPAVSRIDREGYRTWAANGGKRRLPHEGVTVGSKKAAIWSALGFAGAPVEQRTLTGLSVPSCNRHLREHSLP